MTTPPVAPVVTLEQALGAYLGDLGYWVTRTGTDLQELVTAHGAVIRLQRTGGTQMQWQFVARISVEVYAANPAAMWSVANSVASRLSASGGFRAGRFTIDRSANESAPAEVPHPNLRVAAATYRVTTRTPL